MHAHMIGEMEDGQGYAALVMRTAAQEAMSGVRNARAHGDGRVHDRPRRRHVPRVRRRRAPRRDRRGRRARSAHAMRRRVRHLSRRRRRRHRTRRRRRHRGADRSAVRRPNSASTRCARASGEILTAAPTSSRSSRPARCSPRARTRALPSSARTRSVRPSRRRRCPARYVAAHAHGAEGIKRAVRAGVRSIEHGSLMDDEAIELMAAHGTYLVADIYDGDWIAEEGRAESGGPRTCSARTRRRPMRSARGSRRA